MHFAICRGLILEEILIFQKFHVVSALKPIAAGRRLSLKAKRKSICGKTIVFWDIDNQRFYSESIVRRKR